VICEAPGHAACLSALELPDPTSRTDAARELEVVWSVEPEVVRMAVQVCLELARRSFPAVGDRLPDERVPASSGPPSDAQLRLATAIASRALRRMSR
jgi:hypothetical protein